MVGKLFALGGLGKVSFMAAKSGRMRCFFFCKRIDFWAERWTAVVVLEILVGHCRNSWAMVLGGSQPSGSLAF